MGKRWVLSALLFLSAGLSSVVLAAGPCGIQECHGLNITCGPNAPQVCTASYRLGDFCREYAHCRVINGACRAVTDHAFNACKDCVDQCSRFSGPEAFQCESNCRDLITRKPQPQPIRGPVRIDQVKPDAAPSVIPPEAEDWMLNLPPQRPGEAILLMSGVVHSVKTRPPELVVMGSDGTLVSFTTEEAKFVDSRGGRIDPKELLRGRMVRVRFLSDGIGPNKAFSVEKRD